MTHEERQKRQAFWHQQVTEWDATDLSAAAFCRQQPLSYHQFLYWRRQLSPQNDVAVDSMGGFTRVMQVEQEFCGELSVILPGGIRIAGLHAGNVNLLGSILGQL